MKILLKRLLFIFFHHTIIYVICNRFNFYYRTVAQTYCERDNVN